MDVAALVQTATLLSASGIAVHGVVKELARLFSRREIEGDQRTAEHQRPLWKANN
jgi:hypothetical protein